VIGCPILREFTFNEEPTESYIETIDECSMMDSLNNEDDQNILSDLRDEPTSFYFQELQSTYVRKKFLLFLVEFQSIVV
jgi:hypothetical protein